MAKKLTISNSSLTMSIPYIHSTRRTLVSQYPKNVYAKGVMQWARASDAGNCIVAREFSPCGCRPSALV